MYKTVFQNSKAALAFAAMTLFGAVSMVGTSEDSGLLVKAAQIVGSQRDSMVSDAEAFAAQRSVGDAPGNQDGGWGSETAVFSEYAPETAENPAGGPGKRAVRAGDNPMTAPLSSTAVVATPRRTAMPVITDREVSIEPQ